MSESPLRAELVGSLKTTCKLCAFLGGLPTDGPDGSTEWQAHLSLPPEVVAHARVVGALKRRGVHLDEASVRRHRAHHVNR